MDSAQPRTREEQLRFVVDRMFKYLERFTSPTGEIKQYFSMLPSAPSAAVTAFALAIDAEIGSKLEQLTLREQVDAMMRMFNDELLQLPAELRMELDEFANRVVADSKVEIYIKTLHEILLP